MRDAVTGLRKKIDLLRLSVADLALGNRALKWSVAGAAGDPLPPACET